MVVEILADFFYSTLVYTLDFILNPSNPARDLLHNS